MKNINQLIHYIPTIINARNQKYTYLSISNVLDKEFDVQVTDKELSNFYYKFINDKLKTKFTKLKYFKSDSLYLAKNNISKDNFIDFMDSFYICNSSLNIDQSLLINKHNILDIENPVARIYAKWFTRNFQIDNSILLNELEIICSPQQHSLINDIPNNIDDTYDKIIKDLLIKCLKGRF
jgi:hypothetical protein